MPTPAPVQDAITIAKAAVETALKPLVKAQHGNSGEARLYYFKPLSGQPPLPYTVHQPQDLGGRTSSWLNNGAWSGLWTVKTLANDMATALAWMSAIDGGMDSLAAPTGYALMAEYDRPLALPPDGDVWQAGGIWRIYVIRT